MTSIFNSPRLRIARAMEHIDDIEKRIKRYFETCPPKQHYEAIPGGGTSGFLRLSGEWPTVISVIALEALSNLRSALDQACYAIALANGTVKPKSSYFPFADSVNDFDNVVKGRCKDLPPEIIDFIRLIKPYQIGNYPLWGLNKTRSANEHRFVVPIVVQSDMIIEDAIGSGFDIGPSPWDQVRQQMKFIDIASGHTATFKLTFSNYAVFHDETPFGGREVVATLQYLTREVDSIVLGLEAEAERIGIATARQPI